jgi:hypothetical protein
MIWSIVWIHCPFSNFSLNFIVSPFDWFLYVFFPSMNCPYYRLILTGYQPVENITLKKNNEKVDKMKFMFIH